MTLKDQIFLKNVMVIIFIITHMLKGETGKENQRQFNRSNKRKFIKSPIKIREKIKQLQQQFQKQVNNNKILTRDKNSPKDLQIQSRRLINEQPLRQYNKSPNKNIRENQRCFSNDKPVPNNSMVSCRLKTAPKINENHIYKQLISPKMHQFIKRQSQKEYGQKVKRKPSQQEEGLGILKKQNNKYKQIYNYSIEKLQKLQLKLKSIKQSHQNEKLILEGTIDNLKKKIDDKKINIGHLYTYDEKGTNYLIVHDKIITETDNQNSNSIIDLLDKQIRGSPTFSKLSLDSK